ncbi:DUF6930 domain-containing protein [Paenibacillus sp. GCM10023252]|uniref:DUF7309 domain-containing protein n=1 Tax=Paenibacillus sp. GCM10023252 TaxID=3252649 RepID=UPI0036209421
MIPLKREESIHEGDETMLATTRALWIDLFEAAAAFKAERPWDWMDSAQVFGVQDPDSDRINYCCVMGSGGEMFGIAVYPGTSGLLQFMATLSGDLVEPEYTQHAYMLSLDNREDLSNEEYALMKELGLKFRGKHAWPTFRLYEPGYYPWMLQEDRDLRLMTTAIQQSLAMAKEVKPDSEAMTAPQGRMIPTRVSQRSEDGSLSWRTELVEPAPQEEDVILPAPVNELRLAKLKKKLTGQGGAWEVGCFYMPSPVMEGDRPYYPIIFLVADQNSGQVLHVDVNDNKTEMASVVQEEFLELLEQAGMIPSSLMAVDERIFRYLHPVIAALQLPCYLAKELPVLSEVKKGIFRSLTGRA